MSFNKNNILLEVEARKIADILDLRKRFDTLLYFDASENKLGESVLRYVEEYKSLIEKNVKSLRYTKFLLTGWLSQAKVNARKMKEAIASFITFMEPGALVLFYNVLDENKEQLEKELENAGIIDLWSFLNEEKDGNSYHCVLAKIRK